MDYSQLTDTILPDVMAAVKLINNPEVDPEIRQQNMEILFREVGQAVYNKIYEMNAWDMQIPYTTGPGIDTAYYGLAKVASDSVSNGSTGVDAYISNYLDNMGSLAQEHAFTNASQSGTGPTVTRSITNPKACQWCRGLAGTYTDPSSDVFRRHGSCDCSIVTQGYRSRNGELANYAKTN